MDLTISQAATLLGKTPRMVRYLIKSGKVPARKVGRQWMIARDDLTETSPAEQDARREKVAEVRERVDAALDRATPPPADGGTRGFYSVRDMHTYAVAAELLAALDKVKPHGEPARNMLSEAYRALAEFLDLLADACHQYHPRIKVDRLVAARSRATAALAALLRFNLRHPEPDVTPVADRLEGELLGALRGLLRRAERRARRGQET